MARRKSLFLRSVLATSDLIIDTYDSYRLLSVWASTKQMSGLLYIILCRRASTGELISTRRLHYFDLNCIDITKKPVEQDETAFLQIVCYVSFLVPVVTSL